MLVIAISLVPVAIATAVLLFLALGANALVAAAAFAAVIWLPTVLATIEVDLATLRHGMRV